MTNTTNFNFSIPDGTDNVNLLTQNYPNWTSLDAILKAVKDTGITTATATKTGTNFAIVRNDVDCKNFEFVATANFVAADTFTVDGVPVTATAVDGTALISGAFVINQTVVAVLNGTVMTVLVNGGISSVAANDVTYDNTGSGLTATNVQDAIDEVVNDLDDVNANVSTYVSGTILAGNTTITLSDAAILTTSFIDVYFKDMVLAPTAVTVSAGSVQITIEAQAVDVDVAVRIANL